MNNFEKALLDIETAIEVEKLYEYAWILSLKAHVNLGKKNAAAEDIKYMHLYYGQRTAFDIITEFVNKNDVFDVEWFKILVDSYPERAMDKLNDVGQWQALCQQQFEIEDYTRWYSTAKDWYNKYCNTNNNHKNTTVYFEKIYYMHKSRSGI